MPYELATDTDVHLTIYPLSGVVFWTLQLDQQSAGYYADRDRAAYWDPSLCFQLTQMLGGLYRAPWAFLLTPNYKGEKQ